MIEVVAAFIQENNRFMICQRPQNKARGLLWEFVGGKVEAGESKEQALIRECQEELSITIEPTNALVDVTYNYSDISIHLTLFKCIVFKGEPALLEHKDIKWITTSEISEYDFCPADKKILNKLFCTS